MLSGKKTLREFGASCTVSTFPWRENMFLPQLDGVVYQEPGIQAPGLHQCLSLFTALRREARWVGCPPVPGHTAPRYRPQSIPGVRAIVVAVKSRPG